MRDIQIKRRLSKYKKMQPKLPIIRPRPIQPPEEPPVQPIQTDHLLPKPKIYKKEDNSPTTPYTLNREMITNPVQPGIFPIKTGEVKDKDNKVIKEGHTLDFSDMEKYSIFYESPRQMRTYMRYQKARTIEDIKGFGKRTPIKFNWKLILIIFGVFIMMILGFLILTNPSAITDMFKGFM